MTVEQFRKHKYLPSQWARELRTNGILQAVLEVMEENHPCRFVVRGDNNEDVSPTRAAIELGLTRGYSKYGDTLRLMAQPITQSHMTPEPTYEPPQTHEQPSH
jgi:hypothetical protein